VPAEWQDARKTPACLHRSAARADGSGGARGSRLADREMRDEESPFLAPFTRRFESVFATARFAEKHGVAGFSR